MNYRMTARLIAIVLRFVALFMLPALVISLILGETGAVWGLLITMAVMALLSCLPLPFPPRRQTIGLSEVFLMQAEQLTVPPHPAIIAQHSDCRAF